MVGDILAVGFDICHITRALIQKSNTIVDIEPGSQTVWPFVDESVMFPCWWFYVSQNNCDQYIFGDFIDYILRSTEDAPALGDVDDERRILWDNISLQKTAYVTLKIYGCPTNNHFISVNRPPHCLSIALIEYIFCELAPELARRVYEGWTMEDLRLNVIHICSTTRRIGKFENTCVHCNYPYV